MKHLIRQLININSALAKEVEQVFSLPNYKLQLSKEPFGLKAWPKGLYVMRINNARLDRLLTEYLEDEEAFEKRHPLPDGWAIYQVLDILAFLTELQPLTTQKVGNTPRNLARALMQIVEASDSDVQTYIGRESGFPQTLRSFESVADWCLKNCLVTLNATRPIKKVVPKGAFHLSSVERLINDYTRTFKQKKE